MSVISQLRLEEKLDKIVRLLAIQVASDKSVTERARLLKLAGLDNRTIADVLNTTDATVRTLTSNLRNRDSRKSARSRS
jgi:DNA-binding NarL/FixJ family response regulator